jgi:hypothetical protein
MLSLKCCGAGGSDASSSRYRRIKTLVALNY